MDGAHLSAKETEKGGAWHRPGRVGWLAAGPRNGEGKWATRENDEGLRQKQREGQSGNGPAGSMGWSPRKRGKEENSFSFISNPISNMNQTKFE